MRLELEREDVEAIAQRVAELMRSELQAQPSDDRWLTSVEAAHYLGLPSVHQIHKLTAAREIAFSQERAGAACYFRRADLDAYRQRFLRGV